MNRSVDAQAGLVLIYLAALALVLIPIAAVVFPPLLDYPSQLARIFITQNIASFTDFYELSPTLPPNIAGESLIRFLTVFVPIETAGRLFIAFTIAVQLSGVAMLNYAIWRRWDMWAVPLIGALFVYGWTMQMGFLNYLFASGLLLWALALLFLADRWSRPMQAILATGIGVVLAFAHVVSLVLLIVVVGACQLQRGVTSRSWGPLFAQWQIDVPLLLVLALFMSARVAVDGGPLVWTTELHTKVLQLINAVDLGFADKLSTLGVMAVLVLCVRYSARVHSHSEMLFAFVALFIVYLVAPHKIAGGAYLDARIPGLIVLVVIASLRIEFRSRRRARAFLAVVLALLAARSVLLSADFRRFEADAEVMVRALDDVPEHGVVMVAVDGTSPQAGWWGRQRRLWHVADLAALRKPLFVLTTHALPLQHTIVCRQRWQPFYEKLGNVPLWLETDPELDDALLTFRHAVRRAERDASPGRFPMYVLLLGPHDLRDSMMRRGAVMAVERDFLLVRL